MSRSKLKSHSRYDHPATSGFADVRLVRACTGKVSYPSKKNAAAVARLVGESDGSMMNAYHCPSCKKWHVGHLKWRAA